MWQEIKVDRWEGQIDIKIPQSARILRSEARPEEGYDPVSKIKEALSKPLGMDPIGKLVSKASKVAIAFDNPNKVSPSALTIPIILEEVRKAGVKEENIVLVSANGNQRKHTASEFYDYGRRGYGLPEGKGTVTVPRKILEEFWPNRFVRNDAADPTKLVDMGLSRLGDVVECCRRPKFDPPMRVMPTEI